MPGSPKLDGDHSGVDLDDQTLFLTPRLIRHVTSVQVRNLTPFPVRDAFASALKQPSEQPQFTSGGHLSDDLDVTIGRQRARRMSSASSIAIGNSRHESDSMQREFEHAKEPGPRRRTSSRASTSNGPGATGHNLSRRLSTASGVPTVRPAYRQRTISTASSSTTHTGLASLMDPRESGILTAGHIPDLLQDTSQTALENVLQSRLVETFLTITLPSYPALPTTPILNNGNQREIHLTSGKPSQPSTTSSSPSLGRERASTSVQRSETMSKATVRRSTITTSSAKTSSRPAAPSRLSSSSVSRTSNLHAKSASASLPNGKALKSISSSTVHKQHSPLSSSLTSPCLPTSSVKTDHPLTPSKTPRSPGMRETPLDNILHVPDYISPIHWPSANPSFPLDARSRDEFAPGVDLSSSKMHVEVWGHAMRGFGWASARGEDAKGKGKERLHSDEEALEWKVLETWNVDLEHLVPLPEDLAEHPSHLTSNTLLITLSPPGQTFYLPVPAPNLQSPLQLPSASGYSSDPESEMRKIRSTGEAILPNQIRWTTEQFADEPEAQNVSKKHEFGTPKRKGKKRTASWQDLLRLINLQTCISDTQQSLSEVVREIDKVVTHSEAEILRREVSEREAWITQLGKETGALTDQSNLLREQIKARREEHRRRRELLSLARRANESHSQLEFEQDEEIIDEWDRLESLRSQIGPMRSVILMTLSFIFPIDLVSPPDLLFTILDVPLPIPLGATDPAPPLSLAAHKEVTEDAVATALGYAAQVVQLLAAYLGKGLVYPVTCVGSRSLIRDGISAMVGPKMFPLFSKGVDTYRFEYGVFLLNKDIELLMSDRSLRALDMRHTLPNLKNLLLTLTDNESNQRPLHRFSTISSSSISSLQSPVLTASSLPSSSSDTDTPTQTDGLPTTTTYVPADEHESPPQSGSTTPTNSHHPRKSRPFLDLAPLTGFLRSRYPSSSRPSVRSVPESPEGVQEDASTISTPLANGEALQGTSEASGPVEDGNGDEDDRRTIRERGDRIMDPEEGKVEVDVHGNEHVTSGENGRGEKAGEDLHDRTTPTVLVNGVN